MGQSYPPSDVRLLFEGCKVQHLAKGEVLHTTEEPGKLMLLISGFVKRYFIAHEGSLGVQVIYGAEDIFPLTVVFENLFDLEVYSGPEVYYYEAMTSLAFCSMDVATLRKRVETYPVLYRTLLQSAGIRLRSNIQFLENLRLHGAYSKTAHQLAYLANQFGKKTPEGIRIQTPLIHQDIADIIGTTRETVTASIIKLRDKKLIRTDGHILVLDYDELVRQAYS
jgi:CRP/FNR family cyclic AMP-dependent transcriptional regulator